jgi:hypothetical protein
LENSEDSSSSNAVVIAAGAGSIVAATVAASVVGIATGTYYAPRLAIQPHTNVPTFKSTDTAPRPSGSVWVKTTEPNAGARFRVKRYNSATDAFEAVNAPLYDSGHSALYYLDKSGGGANLAAGTLFVKTNSTEDKGSDNSPRIADYKVYRKVATGATTIKSDKITTQVTAGAKTFTIQESLTAQLALDTAKTITFTAVGASSDADLMAERINSAGFTNIEASVDSQNRVVISHMKGGEFRLYDGSGTPLSLAGFAAYNPVTEHGTSVLEGGGQFDLEPKRYL